MTEEKSAPMTALKGLHAHGTRVRHVTDEDTGSESMPAPGDSIGTEGHDKKFAQQESSAQHQTSPIKGLCTVSQVEGMLDTHLRLHILCISAVAMTGIASVDPTTCATEPAIMGARAMIPDTKPVPSLRAFLCHGQAPTVQILPKWPPHAS